MILDVFSMNPTFPYIHEVDLSILYSFIVGVAATVLVLLAICRAYLRKVDYKRPVIVVGSILLFILIFIIMYTVFNLIASFIY